ncbi:MAG: tetratricopeptide repeat protein [Candidatus Sericytochromatia bacterium]|nr:tetratricopeptide repeat protein [Candidatus Sericytochromatia bacterium]
MQPPVFASLWRVCAVACVLVAAADLLAAHPARAAGGGCIPPARLAALTALAMQAPQSADAQFDLALAHLRTPFPERAWPVVDRLLALDPRYGARLVEHQRFVLAAHPQDCEARFRLAAGLYLDGRREAARQELQALVVAAPKDPWAHVYLGWLLAEGKQVDRAIVLWQRVVGLEPENAVAHWLLGQAHQRKGRRARAATALRTALSLRDGYAAMELPAP